MPNTLAAAAEQYMIRSSRGRGEEYFRSGRVSVVSATSHMFVTKVGRSGRRGPVRTAADRRALDDHVRIALEARLAEITARNRVKPPRSALPPPPPAWQTFLSRVAAPTREPAPTRSLPTGELIYVVETARSAAAGGLLVEVLTRDRKKSGDWAKPRVVSIARADVAHLPDERDRRILDVLCGALPTQGRLLAALSFEYGGREVDAWSASPTVFDQARRVAWRRDQLEERRAVARLQSIGVRQLADWQTRAPLLDLALELQATKRHLADAIVRADESLIRDLRREDLELLLS